MKGNFSVIEELFVARDDTYAIQEKSQNGGYCFKKVSSPLTSEILHSHLEGKLTIGIYPCQNNTTKWLVYDIDNSDCNDAIQIEERLRHYNIPGYLEYSGRNWHLWVFFRKPVSNSIVRRFGNYILKEADCQNSVEIFPKQDRIENVGNCIKLPLGKHLKTGEKCEFVNALNLKPFDNQIQFLRSIKSIEETTLREVLQINDTQIKEIAEEKEPFAILEPCVKAYWIEGANEGKRHSVAFQLAIRFKENGVSEIEALRKLSEWLKR